MRGRVEARPFRGGTLAVECGTKGGLAFAEQCAKIGGGFSRLRGWHVHDGFWYSPDAMGRANVVRRV